MYTGILFISWRLFNGCALNRNTCVLLHRVSKTAPKWALMLFNIPVWPKFIQVKLNYFLKQLSTTSSYLEESKMDLTSKQLSRMVLQAQSTAAWFAFNVWELASTYFVWERNSFVEETLYIAWSKLSKNTLFLYRGRRWPWKQKHITSFSVEAFSCRVGPIWHV